MEKNLRYINENYITEDNVCAVTGITKDELNILIQSHLVPDASYVISQNIKITSSLNDEFQSEITEKYFSKNCIQLIHEHKNLENSLQYKAEFKEKFIQDLMKNPSKNFAYPSILKDDFEDEQKINEIFEEEWDAYCKGIYGICTLHSTEEEIVKKEIIVKKLIQFNSLFSQKMLSDNEKEELMKLNEEFNEVASKFAPYQREASSRGKYLDRILEKNNLDHLIKNY
ncbi:hypothetical protein JET18_18705 [Chryseobacterium sp. L7]|uniref:Uncharacterized protein n=1 Tax=Chryseobacterium endalhagicum TaxID=2797638 RepID=A0ABS1QLI2_9FLAO|nr:DUF6058 family natural product biosynthesis protein [Chryseobacterium endalhagicum]MBL1222894.1 hypothetical protein [Chryseobacterium endalhagicum]